MQHSLSGVLKEVAPMHILALIDLRSSGRYVTLEPIREEKVDLMICYFNIRDWLFLIYLNIMGVDFQDGFLNPDMWHVFHHPSIFIHLSWLGSQWQQASRVFQMSLSPATLSSSSWGIPRCSKSRWNVISLRSGQELTHQLAGAIHCFLTENHGLRLRGADPQSNNFILSCEQSQYLLEIRDLRSQQKHVICKEQRCSCEDSLSVRLHLSVYITNRTGDKGQPWQSSTGMETCLTLCWGYGHSSRFVYIGDIFFFFSNGNH